MTRRRAVLGGVGVLAAAALGWGVWGWYLPTRAAVDIGAGLLAKQICSCVFVAERSVEDCRADQFEMMDAIRVEVRHDAGRVRAWLPALGTRTALYRDGLGCVLE